MDDELGVIIYTDIMEIIAGRNHLQTASVEVSPVEMFVVRILPFFSSVGKEIDNAFGFVNLHDLVYMPGA